LSRAVCLTHPKAASGPAVSAPDPGLLFSFDIATRRVQGGWRRIEEADSP
jgi:hypothetical protein